MVQITFKVDGMKCGMCESHVKDIIRKEIPDAKYIKASHLTGKVSYVAENIEEEKISKALASQGYICSDFKCEIYKNSGVFAKIFHK